MRGESAEISASIAPTADIRGRAHDKLTWSSLLSVIITDFGISNRYAELIYPISSLIPAHLPPTVVLFLSSPSGQFLVLTSKLNSAFARFDVKLELVAFSTLDSLCDPHFLCAVIASFVKQTLCLLKSRWSKLFPFEQLISALR